MMRFIGPLVIAPTIALIGISLFRAAADTCADNWYIAAMTIVLVVLFSQYFRNIEIPVCKLKRNHGFMYTSFPLFKLFPIILAIVCSWMLCAILTAIGAIPDDPVHWAYKARTDTKAQVLHNAQWFRFPYPGQWGTPTFSTAGAFGMLSGVMAGIIESIGDYYACARLSGAPPPPVHAINRGVFIEGIGVLLNGLFGTGTGTTSLSQNSAIISLTKVGSTRVSLCAGIIMILFGIVGKFGAIFVTIPTPVIGGTFMTLFGMIAAVGISNLQFVDMNSSRNLFIFGFSMFFGLSLPYWVSANVAYINTSGIQQLDQIITVLLSTGMFVGGLVAFVLDNTVPGTNKERGITVWRRSISAPENDLKRDIFHAYDFPVCMNLVKQCKCTKYCPICPTFSNCKCFCKH